MNRGGFGWKRAVGITNAKRRVSRATGIPWTKAGRQRKLGSMFWKLFNRYATSKDATCRLGRPTESGACVAKPAQVTAASKGRLRGR
jgi:hypothetical protein